MNLFIKKSISQFVRRISPWWWICMLLFVAHQILEKILGVELFFLDNYLDPFLSMPILLGIHLVERRRFFKEGPSFVLPLFEVMVIGLFAALIFEEGWPRWFDGFYKDKWDYLSYGLGVLFFIQMVNIPAKQ